MWHFWYVQKVQLSESLNFHFKRSFQLPSWFEVAEIVCFLILHVDTISTVLLIANWLCPTTCTDWCMMCSVRPANMTFVRPRIKTQTLWGLQVEQEWLAAEAPAQTRPAQSPATLSPLTADQEGAWSWTFPLSAVRNLNFYIKVLIRGCQLTYKLVKYSLEENVCMLPASGPAFFVTTCSLHFPHPFLLCFPLSWEVKLTGGGD
jgi:hypothetical protein